MNSMTFKIGDRYENRRGTYEVIAIDGDKMAIRWDNGDTIQTTQSGQAKVLRNMQREIDEALKLNKKMPEWYGALFNGVAEKDFGIETKGTTWRSRESMGGLIISSVSAGKAHLNSWSIYGSPIIHIADKVKYARCEPRYQAKLMVRTFPEHYAAGLMIERSNVAGDFRDDWNNFIAWLHDHESELIDLINKHNLRLSDPYRTWDGSLRGVISAGPDGLLHQIEVGKEPVKLDRVTSLLSAVNNDTWVDLFIAAYWPKDQAISRGRALGADTGNLFTDMMPLYAAATKLSI
jgi:hypothetical protein